jgi:glutathione S-transferase
VPSAFERYLGEVKRVSGVLEAYLGGVKEMEGEGGSGGGGGGDGPWLVGGKLTYADISFIPWYCWMEWFLDEEEFRLEEYPLVKDWLDRMRTRESVAKVLSDIKPENAKK